MQIPLVILFCLNLTAGAVAFLAALITAREDIFPIAMVHTGIAGLVLFPIFTKIRIRLFDPLNLVMLYILIGGLAPAYFIAFNQTPRIQFLMANRDLDSFTTGALWYAISLILLGAGYAACRKRLPVERVLPSERKLSAQGFQFALISGTVISIISILIYIQSTGGISASISDISRKRSIEVLSHGEVVHASGAYLRMLSDISTILLLVVIGYYLSRFKRLPLYILVQIWVLAILSLAVPFVASSRLSVIYVGLAVLIALSTRERLSVRTMVIAGAAALIMFGAMTALRSTAQRGGEGGFQNPFLALAESGNGLSLFGTAHIVNGVPERMDYQLGSTYLTWIFAPVPRTIWPDKPDVSLGKRIKAEVLQQRVIKTGRPPSIISEGWINFGAAGFLFNAFLFGYVLRLIGNSLEPVVRDNAFAVPVLYTLTLNTAELSNSALSQGIVRILTDFLLIMLVFGLIQYSVARKTAPAH